MKPAIKSKIPLTFLATVSMWWGYYYSSSNELNGYGSANYEWLFMLDAFFVLPALCFFCESDKQKAILKAILLCCTAVFIGSLIIPEQSKQIFHFLESARYVVLAVILLFEISAVVTVCLAVRAALAKKVDPDLAVANPIEKMCGTSILSSILAFEGRMWCFALFSSQISSDAYQGEQHFYYDKKDGAQSNLLGFLSLLIIEIPLVHLLLHFLWSGAVAAMATALSLVGLVFFFAEYKAVAKRPISICGNKLIVRYGLASPIEIPLNNIAGIDPNASFVKRASDSKRFNYAGVPNVVIALYSPVNGKKALYLGVNSPDVFINSVQEAKAAASLRCE